MPSDQQSAYRILIVEDDPSIAAALQRHLNAWGFSAICVEEFHNVIGVFQTQKPQLVVLDICLPFFNGYHWCAEIRRQSKVPILYLSSAADKMNIVMAMSMGGDDFVTKPFDLEVLTAKIQALLRRCYDFSVPGCTLTHRGATLNTDDASLSFNGQRLPLTRNEYRIVHTLLEAKGKIVSRDALMTALWETDCYVDENTLNVNVARLRRRLENLGLTGFILTKKGLGYLVE